MQGSPVSRAAERRETGVRVCDACRQRGSAGIRFLCRASAVVFPNTLQQLCDLFLMNLSFNMCSTGLINDLLPKFKQKAS